MLAGNEEKILGFLQEAEENLKKAEELLGSDSGGVEETAHLHRNIQHKKQALLFSLAKTVRKLVKGICNMPQKRRIWMVPKEEWLSDKYGWFKNHVFACREIKIGKGVYPFYQFEIDNKHVGFMFSGNTLLSVQVLSSQGDTVVIKPHQIDVVESMDSYWFIIEQSFRFVIAAIKEIDIFIGDEIMLVENEEKI